MLLSHCFHYQVNFVSALLRAWICSLFNPSASVTMKLLVTEAKQGLHPISACVLQISSSNKPGRVIASARMAVIRQIPAEKCLGNALIAYMASRQTDHDCPSLIVHTEWRHQYVGKRPVSFMQLTKPATAQDCPLRTVPPTRLHARCPEMPQGRARSCARSFTMTRTPSPLDATRAPVSNLSAHHQPPNMQSLPT